MYTVQSQVFFLKESDISLLTDQVEAKIIDIDNMTSNDFIYPFTLNIRNGKSIKRSLKKKPLLTIQMAIIIQYSNIKSENIQYTVKQSILVLLLLICLCD